VAPGLGSAQGAVFVFSDLLSDHQLYLLLSSFAGSGFGNLLDNFSGTAFYLNQSHRINWGVGAFRQRGLFYEGDFSTLYDETSGGVFATCAIRCRASRASKRSTGSSTPAGSISPVPISSPAAPPNSTASAGSRRTT